MYKILVINRGEQFGSLNRATIETSRLYEILHKKLKENKAKKVIDNETTLMYHIY
jgi:hypothetical protein